MAPHVQPAVKMFNAFLRELVLVAKKHCSAQHKSSLKKAFKLFDSASPKYANAFIARRSKSTREDSETLIFDGITSADIQNAVPEAEKELVGALVAGVTMAATLLDDDTGDETVGRVANAILQKDPSSVDDILLDDELTESLNRVTVVDLAERLLADLRAAADGFSNATHALPSASAQSLGIVGLAEEISRELDISSLMMSSNASHGQAGLATIIDSINQKVQGRIQDGSVDAARLCSEAQAILGGMSST